MSGYDEPPPTPSGRWDAPAEFDDFVRSRHAALLRSAPFRLTCAVSAVPAHGAVRFEVRTPIPDDTTETGPVKLAWHLETDSAGTGPRPWH